MKAISYRSIGIVRSPFKTREKMPIQPSGARGVRGSIEIENSYLEGLKDLDGFSHIILIYHFHLATGYALTVVPFLDDRPRGVFATRAPKRPNAIGLSVVKLLSIKENVLDIENVDIIDGTPLLDIKPYVPEFDVYTDTRTGWLAQTKMAVKQTRSDDRFK